MLDFSKLVLQIRQVGVDSLLDNLGQEDILRNGCLAFESASEDQEEFARKLEKNSIHATFPTAIPLEQFGHTYSIKPIDEPVTVVAVDGSQIMPSHHEVHNCYLLNMGITALSYGVKLPALLESEPHLFSKPSDLYPLVNRRRMHVDEMFVSLERTLLELETLLKISLQQKSKQLPVVALMDGSLLPWSTDKMPETYQRDYIKRLVKAFDSFHDEGIPVIGYVSHSRSSDLVNNLRIWICPYEQSRCQEFCATLNEEDFPCSTIWPLSDRQLLSGNLDNHKRTATFLSGVGVNKPLPEHCRICFSYIHTGFEVARLEFPRWVLAPKLSDLAFSTVLSQVIKGQGYPVSLSEAHHLAVIKGSDRSRFFDLLTKQLISLGLRRVATSPKENRKRRGII